MKSRKERTPSIIGRINSMSNMLIVLLGLPVIAVMIMTVAMAGQYSTINSRMSIIADLKPVIETEIPEAVWTVVSGRATMGDSGVEDRISEANQIMERITAQTEEEHQLELIVARRTMDTLSQYVDKISENLAERRPVVENEAVLGEIRDVAALVGSMLNNYITDSIDAGRQIVDRITRIAYIGSAAEILLLLIAVFMTAEFRKRTARFIREPIEKLERVTARLAEGDMSARLPLTQVEELWNLTGKVNIMAENLKDMMRQRVKDERNLKKAELRTLQAQINPHFLYNTLDAIVWKAEVGDQAEVINLTRALSDFFRISLSSGADWIPVSQEKKHIVGYLSIQKTRYHDILNYEIDIDDSIGDCYVLKLLLQPLVENALYHGIKYKRGGGIIRVTGKKQGDDLFFSVYDSGKGMDPETLEKVRTRMRESSSPSQSGGTGGFGLLNVNLRLRLYYNRTEGLSITSGKEGTTVCFSVPSRTAVDIENENQIIPT